MFERFTDRARRATVLSQEVARMRGDLAITPWHLLAGLEREAEGIAALVIKDAGAYPKIVARLGAETGGEPPTHIPFTPDTKKVLEMSLREALQLGHNYIGTEHILLGLIRNHEEAMREVGITRLAVVEKLRSFDPPGTVGTFDLGRPKRPNLSQLEINVTCDGSQAVAELERIGAAADACLAKLQAVNDAMRKPE